MAKTLTDQVEFLKIFTGCENVYTSPPSKGMKYPCIWLEPARPSTKHADNRKYINKNSAKLTVIDYDIDSPLDLVVSELPMCSWDRHYVADNLNHFVHTLFY